MNKSGMDIEKKNDWQGLNFKEFIYIQQESTKPNFFYIIFFLLLPRISYKKETSGLLSPFLFTLLSYC